jgi:hypothetical protein
MDAGRKALLQRGDNEFGPYQSPMEDGMQKFHEWYRTAMAWGQLPMLHRQIHGGVRVKSGQRIRVGSAH